MDVFGTRCIFHFLSEATQPTPDQWVPYFTRYSGNIFQLWRAGSKSVMWHFFRILYTKHYSSRLTDRIIRHYRLRDSLLMNSGRSWREGANHWPQQMQGDFEWTFTNQADWENDFKRFEKNSRYGRQRSCVAATSLMQKWISHVQQQRWNCRNIRNAQ